MRRSCLSRRLDSLPVGTMHQMFEPEMHDYYKIPESYGVVAVIPIGFPEGKFGPVSRDPVETKTHYGKWGNHSPD